LLLLPYVSYLRECIDQQLFEISSLLPPLTPDLTGYIEIIPTLHKLSFYLFSRKMVI
jgi:hypothetical protein